MRTLKILFLVPYPLDEAPSQRFRFEQYFFALRRENIHYRVQSFLNKKSWRVIYSKGQSFRKGLALISGILRRLVVLAIVPGFDCIFIHREAAPIGPPVIEWVIAKILRKKIIYDFDDAIWNTDKRDESFLEELIRWRSKVGSICKWSYRVSAGNSYLCAYAQRFNSSVVLLPTTIDTENAHRPSHAEIKSSRVTVGWTGSHSTLKYLSSVIGVLKNLEAMFPFVDVLVIADKDPLLPIPRSTFLPWSKATEISDLEKIDIGIMPLPDDEWSKGKCGFKALQYMALEIPAVASPVGVNTAIIQHGMNGFLCITEKEWTNTLAMLIQNVALRKKIGIEGRKTIVDHYSVAANVSVYLSLFHV
jgi:glycosyltransferase involved in cell wall biosynthesis